MSTTAIARKNPDVQSGPACTRVLVIDQEDNPLMPCKPARARYLLKQKRADVACANPFTIRLLDRDQESCQLQPMELKFDPGSKTTGMALMVLGIVRGWFCVGAWELEHRGQQIRNSLLSRSQCRRGRRNRNTRYREARFLNRTKPKGWLPPSLRSRVDNVLAFASKLKRYAPISALAVEQVRFDTQLLRNPEISGIEYQQGTLFGYEVREYLLEKWNRACTHCSAEGLPLQIEHILAKSRGGTNAITNLCLACQVCNQKKGNRSIEDFLKGKPDLLKRILVQAKAPLKDAAAVNSTRLAIVRELEALGPPVSTSTGGRTKFNRTTQGYSKAHWLDAVCVGETGGKVDVSEVRQITMIQAKGRGSRQMCLPDKYGFPRTKAKTVKRLHGFQTGDRVRLAQPSGRYQGTHEGVVGIRAAGQFDIKTTDGTKITAPHTRFSLLSRFDGYNYRKRAA